MRRTHSNTFRSAAILQQLWSQSVRQGLYLNFIANPFPYAINVPPTLFGFVYHWPYQWAGGDIAVLRMANVAFTMALGWIVSFLAIRRFWSAGWPQAAVLSAGIASLALCNFLGWWLTPSYYSLAFQSLLMVMTGLFLADGPGRVRQVLAWILVDVGGWCCFVGKPTTAATIAIVVMLYVVVLRGMSLLPGLGAALVALVLLIVTACLINGGITGLMNRMINGAATETQGDGHGASLMLVLPHLFALGSNLNCWRLGAMGALFWMLAVVSFLSPLAQQGRSIATLLPLTVLAQLLTASVANAGILKPWCQAKDLRSNTAVMHMPGGGNLVLSQSLHDYLTTARAQARAAGLDIGTPVIDLTGLSPSLLYVLKARAVRLPWLIGREVGSNAVAVETLRLENCADLPKAWVLTEPDGPYYLDQASVTASFGAGLADYVAAATFAPPAISYRDYLNAARQFLFQPTRPAVLAERSCLDARR